METVQENTIVKEIQQKKKLIQDISHIIRESTFISKAIFQQPHKKVWNFAIL